MRDFVACRLVKIQILDAMRRPDPTRRHAYRHAHPEIYLFCALGTAGCETRRNRARSLNDRNRSRGHVNRRPSLCCRLSLYTSGSAIAAAATAAASYSTSGGLQSTTTGRRIAASIGDGATLLLLASCVECNLDRSDERTMSLLIIAEGYIRRTRSSGMKYRWYLTNPSATHGLSAFFLTSLLRSRAVFDLRRIHGSWSTR